jgi:hypothetical protein
MRIITLTFVGLAALASASIGTSRAEDGCGAGWYWNGDGCVPMHQERHGWHHEDRWRHHHEGDDYRDYGHHDGDNYGDYRRYDRPHDQPSYSANIGGFGNEARYNPPNPKWHTPNGCAPHFTVQDGLCKPYTGR